MSTILPLHHPLVENHTLLGHQHGNRAAVLEYHAKFAIGFDRDVMLHEAICQVEMARWHFTWVHQRADYSEPEVRLSEATLRAFEAERARENAPPAIYPGKGAHWAGKRAAKAA